MLDYVGNHFSYPYSFNVKFTISITTTKLWESNYREYQHVLKSLVWIGEGNVLDAIGECGGDCFSDINNNQICDSSEIVGCTWSWSYLRVSMFKEAYLVVGVYSSFQTS